MPTCYRLLALDLDGTLIDQHGDTTEENLAALAAARAAGLDIVVVTGRRYQATKPLLTRYGLDGEVICANGALVYDSRADRLLAHHGMGADVFARVCAALAEAPQPAVANVVRDHDPIELVARRGARGGDAYRRYLDRPELPVAFVDRWDELPPAEVLRMVLLGTPAEMDPVEAFLYERVGAWTNIYRIERLTHIGHLVEVFDRRTSKWTAVAALAARRGIAPAAVVAIGDDGNDRELLTHAGLGIAMGNAPPAIRAVADRVTDTCEAGGVARALWELLRE